MRRSLALQAGVRALLEPALRRAKRTRLKLYVQNGGMLVATCNTGLVDEHHIVADKGFPFNMTDLFGMEVQEFDPIDADR